MGATIEFNDRWTEAELSRLGEGIAAAADVVGRLQALHEEHIAFLDLIGDLQKLRRPVQASETSFMISLLLS